MPQLEDDLEYGEEETDRLNRDAPPPVQQPEPTRSIYTMTRSEITKGIANRFVHSRVYIALYLGMAALSVTTVVLSLVARDGCPVLAFYILEIIVNISLILEVAVRFVAFGSQFWKSPFNVLDLIVTVFCALTLLVLAFGRCGTGTKEEELFDTLLLVARNILQFIRLASVMRQSGQSILSAPKLIDINARRLGNSRYSNLDIDLDSEEEDYEASRPLVNGVVFDSERDGRETRTLSEMPRAVESANNRDDEDMWAAMG